MKDKSSYCEHHKPSDLGYLAWHDWARRCGSQKYYQVFCEKCNHYLYPHELNEPDNPKSIKSIERHEKYLEQHPKAIPVKKV